MTVLKTQKVCVTRSGADLIKDISVSLRAGEILAIVGPNGAGKTTLLNAVSGDIDYRGDIEACRFDQAYDKLTADKKRARARSIAVLPQFSLLNFPYVVEDVVALGRTPHDTGVVIDQGIVEDAMAAMDIGYLKGRLYTQLSGGEKQRTQLARVMTQIWRKEDAAQRLLLLDEPTTALDLGHQQQLMRAVTDFAANGVAVLMIVHDINIAAKYAHTMCALSCGRSVAQGKVEDIMTETLLKSLFHADLTLIEDPITHRKVVLS